MHTLIRELADNDRMHDPWGAGMGALGAVCDVLCHEGGEIPAIVKTLHEMTQN